ncbi:MAG: hypothetical protein IT365_19475 [Candidatus Hydrogenedentes bacterium]|nr:hypothetical protein [Candidatus Hydrogenedentota bacterium]
MKRIAVVALAVAMALLQPAQAGVGSLSLVDDSGLEYFLNSDVTFTTSSMASGAASDATYTTVVAATTSAGGTTPAVLANAFEGYNALFVNGTAYNMNGPATPDGDCANRQFVFSEQTIDDDLVVTRKVYVPDNDEFCRWLNIIENTGTSDVNVTVTIVNNLGSDGDTLVAESSVPPAGVTTADDWIVSFEDYTLGASPSPRLGHVLQGPNSLYRTTVVTFVNGSDTPFWEYAFTLPAGATYSVLNFVTGQPGKADARTKCQELVQLPTNARACLTDEELEQVVNFDTIGPTVTISSTVDNPTNVSPMPISVTFSEDVTGFDEFDLVVTNGTVSNFEGEDDLYTFDLEPLAVGKVKIDIAADVAQDGAGNGNQKATTFKRDFDDQGPTVTMTSPTPDPTNIITVMQVTVQFSSDVTGFDSTDIVPLNAEIGDFSGADDTYYFTVTPLLVSGTVGADIRANVCLDEAGNPNQAGQFRRQVKPVQSCFNRVTTKSAGTPVRATLGDMLPLAAAGLTLLGLGGRAHRRKK